MSCDKLKDLTFLRRQVTAAIIIYQFTVTIFNKYNNLPSLLLPIQGHAYRER